MKIYSRNTFLLQENYYYYLNNLNKLKKKGNLRFIEKLGRNKMEGKKALLYNKLSPARK